MMMFRVLLAALSIASIPSAQASQVAQVELSSNAGLQRIQMMDQKFEPIYEQQPYTSTCSREVLDHMESVCSTVSDTVCHGTEGEVCTTQSDQVCNSRGCTNIPRRVCHQEHRVCNVVPRRVCSDRAVMRTEFYACTRYRTVEVGQRLVKTFQHNVELAVDRPELLQDQKLVLSLLARQDSISQTLVSSFNLNLLTVEQQLLGDSDIGGNEVITTRILIHVDASTASLGKILSSSVQELNLSRSNVSISIPGLAELSNALEIHVRLVQNRLIDKHLANITLNVAEVATVQGDSLKLDISMAKLRVQKIKAGKKHNLNVSVSLKCPSHTVLNTRDMAAILGKSLDGSLTNAIP